MGRNNKKKRAKHKQAKPSTSQGGGGAPFVDDARYAGLPFCI